MNYCPLKCCVLKGLTLEGCRRTVMLLIELNFTTRIVCMFSWLVYMHAAAAWQTIQCIQLYNFYRQLQLIWFYISFFIWLEGSYVCSYNYTVKVKATCQGYNGDHYINDITWTLLVFSVSYIIIAKMHNRPG